MKKSSLGPLARQLSGKRDVIGTPRHFFKRIHRNNGGVRLLNRKAWRLARTISALSQSGPQNADGIGLICAIS